MKTASQKKIKRKNGFLSRMKKKSGQKVLSRKRKKGRKITY